MLVEREPIAITVPSQSDRERRLNADYFEWTATTYMPSHSGGRWMEEWYLTTFLEIDAIQGRFVGFRRQ